MPSFSPFGAVSASISVTKPYLYSLSATFLQEISVALTHGFVDFRVLFGWGEGADEFQVCVPVYNLASTTVVKQPINSRFVPLI